MTHEDIRLDNNNIDKPRDQPTVTVSQIGPYFVEGAFSYEDNLKMDQHST